MFIYLHLSILPSLVLLNYNRIRDVERDLSQLQLQLRLTAGPKRQGLELLRRKIEEQNERVVSVRRRHDAAKQALLVLEEELKREEDAKERLCGELNTLIQQNADQQASPLTASPHGMNFIAKCIVTEYPPTPITPVSLYRISVPITPASLYLPHPYLCILHTRIYIFV